MRGATLAPTILVHRSFDAGDLKDAQVRMYRLPTGCLTRLDNISPVSALTRSGTSAARTW
jgi:hypothetical protein